LTQAFEQFLEVSSFARRTRESYAEDLAPLLAEVGQKLAIALTAMDLQTVNFEILWAEFCELRGRQNKQKGAATVFVLGQQRALSASRGCSRLSMTHPQNSQDSAHGIPKFTPRDLILSFLGLATMR
jgi:hypothetical protein